MENDLLPELYPIEANEAVRYIFLEMEIANAGEYRKRKANFLLDTPNPIPTVFIIPIFLLNGT